jgi:hypothetical protein
VAKQALFNTQNVQRGIESPRLLLLH